MIINLSSGMGLRGRANWSLYSLAKGAIARLTQSLCEELGQYNIRVNSIAPGLFDTELGAAYRKKNVDHRPRMIAGIPVGRIGKYEELDGALLLLASNASSYMTASVLFVDGGCSENGIA